MSSVVTAGRYILYRHHRTQAPPLPYRGHMNRGIYHFTALRRKQTVVSFYAIYCPRKYQERLSNITRLSGRR